MPLVTPSHVLPAHKADKYFIEKMKNTLSRQGQIEPLQVQFTTRNSDGTELYMTFAEDAWGSEIVLAAQSLGWSHILIHITDRYEY